MDLGCVISSLTILWEAAVFVYIIIYVCLATFNFQSSSASCFSLGKLRYNVLALVPSDRTDVVLCQNSWELSSDCLVHEEQPLLLSANSVVEVSDQVQTLPVGCDTSCCFCIFMSL